MPHVRIHERPYLQSVRARHASARRHRPWGRWRRNAPFQRAADTLPGWFPGRVYRENEVVHFAAGSSGVRHARVVSTARCTGKSRKADWLERRGVECFILLLSRDGSTGLDLSMTTHIFIVDKIWDIAVEDQVVSRAWRLGAVAPSVHVEQLYTTGTVEELMYEWGARGSGEWSASELSRGASDGSEDVTHKAKRRSQTKRELARARADAKRATADFGKLHYLLSHMRVLGEHGSAGRGPEQQPSARPEKRSRARRVMFADEVVEPLVQVREL